MHQAVWLTAHCTYSYLLPTPSFSSCSRSSSSSPCCCYYLLCLLVLVVVLIITIIVALNPGIYIQQAYFGSISPKILPNFGHLGGCGA